MITAYSLIVWRLWVNQMPGEANQANVIAQKKAKKKVIINLTEGMPHVCYNIV